MESIIYPTTKTKYTGTYKKRRRRYAVIIASSGVSLHVTVDTEAEAFELLKAKNIEFDLPIKNLIHRVDDHYEFELGDICAKFDDEDLELVQNHTWYYAKRANSCHYVRTNVRNEGGGYRIKHMHQFLMPDPPEDYTVDHININGLDNRRANLRYATRRIQTINRRILPANTSGITGIGKTKNGYWGAYWRPIQGKSKAKFFSIAKNGDDVAKAMAIAYRESVISLIADYQ
jgi:hypothetical protein